ncbi:hypothetical protein OHB19_34175 [Streptomyces sp. NBC_00893]|nr:hypothetical protein [Streptomyces sp. NBC_00893]MCX4850317.1 hypothetical protein [Streptomyces sp. NBC_00893]
MIRAKTPSVAVEKNAERQPKAAIRGATRSGVRTPATALELMIRPLAPIRSSGVVRSTRTFSAAGGKTPSAAPNANRITSRTANDQAKPVSAVKTDHASRAQIVIRCAPYRSVSIPPGI